MDSVAGTYSGRNERRVEPAGREKPEKILLVRAARHRGPEQTRGEHPAVGCHGQVRKVDKESSTDRTRKRCVSRIDGSISKPTTKRHRPAEVISSGNGKIEAPIGKLLNKSGSRN